MSLGIAVTTTEGIVLAADSRQSYQNRKGMGRVGSDSAQKVFSLTDRVGVVVAGLAFLEDNGVPKNISRFIEDFKRIHELKKLTVQQISDKLVEFFSKKYKFKKILENLQPQVAANLKSNGMEMIEHKIENGTLIFKFKDAKGEIQSGVAGIDGLHFIVAGYNSDGSHMVCNIGVPGLTRVVRDSVTKGKEYGADWIGQTDVVTRIVLGYDGRAFNLPFMQKAVQDISEQQVKAQLTGLEYVIQWGAMTLQDAVDFSRLAIETTTSIQRFSDGIQMDQGDMPGVGGSVDIAYISMDEDFTWLKKKELSVEY
jgi:hypothetical protein